VRRALNEGTHVARDYPTPRPWAWGWGVRGEAVVSSS